MANEQKKGLSTNSNAYTIIYSAVLVIIVAFLLSFVASSLKERQEANERNDKRAQILAAINVTEGDVEANFAKYVKPLVVNANGDVVDGEDGFELDFTKKATDQKLPVYQCNVDGQVKFIVPVKGNGLWGPIWGYVGLNDDKSTVYGIYFNHEGETPGLGAEIVTDAFRGQFLNKQIKNANGDVVSIAVLKKGIKADGQDQVDAISGGTITSSGVDAMLKTSLKKYDKFLTK